MAGQKSITGIDFNLSVYPLYYNYDVRAFTSALRGPRPYAPGGAPTWALEQWEFS